jgi:CysZ protein
MLDAAVKALAQMFSPPFRAVLLKSVLLALVLIVVMAIGLHRGLSWLAGEGGEWAQGALGPGAHTPLSWILWIVSIATGLGILFGSVFLMPAVTSLMASFFADEIAAEVERVHYPADPPGRPVALANATWEGVKTALLAVVLYLLAVPMLLLAGIGALVFFFVTAFLLGREYFELAAMRFRTPAEAKAFRKRHAGKALTAGLMIAAFVSIPILNLATPLFGVALMVHVHKKLSGGRRDILAPSESPARALPR